jgi:hypothetical protein
MKKKPEEFEFEFELEIGSFEVLRAYTIKFEQARIALLLHVADEEKRTELTRASAGLEYDLFSAIGLSNPSSRDEYIAEKLRELDDNHFEVLAENFAKGK